MVFLVLIAVPLVALAIADHRRGVRPFDHLGR